MNCAECGNLIPVGDEYVYHTESTLKFCTQDCANQFDMKFRELAINDEEGEEGEEEEDNEEEDEELLDDNDRIS